MSSSPLAAIRPVAPLAWDHAARPMLFHERAAVRNVVGLERPSSTLGYFNIKGVQGSSPTASLAADLSQNFRIDNEASPRFPTPRRALFTAQALGALDTRRVVTTPDDVPSSPVQLDEIMDMSPLPHKQPSCAQVEVLSPTEISPHDDSMDADSVFTEPIATSRASSLGPSLAPSPALEPARPSFLDRRRSVPRRPSLGRVKGPGFSFGEHPPPRQASDSQVSLFRFGRGFGGESGSSAKPALSLDQCFMECSPPHDRRPQSVDSPTPGVAPPMQRHKSIFGGGAVGNEPRIGHARRPSNPVMRRRKQFRRSLSMFENPGDIMRPKEDSPPSCAALQAVMDVEEPPQPALPHFVKEDGGDSIPRITRETLLRVLDGEFRDRYDEKMIIDCRFEYEYEGGHIMGAVNYNDKELLARKLFADGTHEQQARGDRILIIFHCEYSAHRAPMMARHIRAEDRAVNAASYPRLSYPEMYILDGGYSGFFEAHRDRCFPQNYVEMDAAEHARTCEREMGRLKRGAAGGGRKGLSRAQTYAFGQQQRSLDSHSSRAPFASLDCHQLDDSPTAPLGRGHMALHAVPAPESSPLSMLDSSPCLALDRGHTRRMASY